MKSTTFALVAAAIPLAIAVPFEKRAGAYEMDYVTDLRVSTVTTQITVYYTGQPAAQTVYPTPAAPAPAVVTAAPSESDSYTYVAQAAAEVADAPAPSVEVASVQPESVAEQPVVQAIQSTTDDSSAAAPAVAQAPAQSVSSGSVPAGGYGPGPYSVQTGSGVIEAYTGASTGDDSYDASNGVFQANLLDAHNRWRAQYQAPPLTWNYTSAAGAVEYVNACDVLHRGGPTGTGQNNAMGAAGPAAACDMWGDEYSLYDWSNPGWNDGVAGHFSALVWHATTSVGCAAVNCGAGKGWNLACNYFPAGNDGGYAANVLPKAS